MKKVIDAGALRSALLCDFLTSSSQNIAVITDYAAFESFQGNANLNARNSFKIIRQYPNQVVILKNTPAICCLRPKQKGLHARLIDHQQTAGFGKYCESIYNHPSSSRVLHDFRLKEKTANDFRKHLLLNANTLRNGINELEKRHAPEDIHALRTQNKLTPQFAETVTKDILMLTAILLKNSNQLPESKDVLFSFQFRYSLCCYIESVNWMIKGGHQNRLNSKVKNDFIDATYSAYATLFDGILSKDEKLNKVYIAACHILRNIFRLRA